MTLPLSRTLLVLAAFSFLSPHRAAKLPTGPSEHSLAQCKGVRFSAAYLVEERPGQGPGFLLTVTNERAVPIAIPDPAPLSVDWYVEQGRSWSWRSSSGSGGALVDASRPVGPLFPARQRVDPVNFKFISAHGSYDWAVFSGEVPALQYRPGCEHCGYTGETRFRAVLAYAYVPSGPGVTPKELLHCGLRSNPVVMPPLSLPAIPHNFGAGTGSLRP